MLKAMEPGEHCRLNFLILYLATFQHVLPAITASSRPPPAVIPGLVITELPLAAGLKTPAVGFKVGRSWRRHLGIL